MFSKIRRLLMKQFTVCPRTGKITGLKTVKGKTSWLWIVIGLASVIWVLIRVVPKPCDLSLSKGGSTDSRRLYCLVIGTDRVILVYTKSTLYVSKTAVRGRSDLFCSGNISFLSYPE